MSRSNYVRVKNWSDHQHYKDRMPPWIKFYGRLLSDDTFGELGELEQWQLVRIWLTASLSTKFSRDQDGKVVPVVPRDASTVQRAIKSLRRVPIATFERVGFLIPVLDEDVVTAATSTEVAALIASALASTEASTRDSTSASALLGLENYNTQEREETQVFPHLALASSQPLNRGNDDSPIGKLRRACNVTEGSHDDAKLKRAMHGVCEADIIDLALGAPRDVRSRLGWTLAELKKRRQTSANGRLAD